MKTILQNKNLTILFASTFLFFCNEAMFLPTMPLYLLKAGYTNMEIGIIQGSFAMGVLLFRPLSGFITDRKSRKLSLVLGVVIFFIAPLFYLFTTRFSLLLMIRAFHGMGITFYTTACPTLVTDIVPERKWGEVLGHMATATTLAFTLSPLLAMMLYNGPGFPAMVAVCMATGVINLIVILRLKEHKARQKPEKTSSYRAILTSRSVVVASGIQIVNAIIFGGMMTFLPILLTKNGLNAGLFFLMESISIISCRLLAARLSDELGRGPVFFYSFIIVLASLCLVSRITTVHIMIVAGALFGTGSALVIPSLSAFIADETDPDIRGTVYGIFNGAFDAGVIIAGTIMGYIADMTSIESMYLITAFSGAVCLILFALFIRKGVWASLCWTLAGDRRPPNSCDPTNQGKLPG